MGWTGRRSCLQLRNALVVLCALSLVTAQMAVLAATSSEAQGAGAGDQAATIAPDQLDALVAPIALYPDPLLAQTLAASTYPLEIIQLQQWLTRNPGLKGKALADAVVKQPWDPSIQAMASLPEVVKRLSDDIQWTTDLGNAFLAQQGDVMNAVQRMRRKASDKGTLKTTPQQTVVTRVEESKTVIVVEQADPQVVYVPSYNPVVVYGDPIYPYPPIYYPPPAYYAGGLALAFGVGVAMGAARGGGGWGWGCGWGNSDITVNRNNNFNRNTSIRNGNIGNGNVRGGNRWQHSPEHRGGAPYRDRATAQRFGGTARGESLSNRQATARREVARQGGNVPSNGLGDRGAIGGRDGLGDRGGVGGRNGLGDRGGVGGRNGLGDRGGVGGRDSPGNRGGVGGRDGLGDRGGVGGRGGPGDRGGAADRGAGSLGGNRPGGGGSDRIGSQNLSRGGGGNRDAFGGSGGGYNGREARANSNRGASSMGARSGGARGGGGGGARRGGGGRRR